MRRISSRAPVCAIFTSTFGDLELPRWDFSLEELIKLGISSASHVWDPNVDEDAAKDANAEEHVSGLRSNRCQLKGNDDVGDGSNNRVGTCGECCGLGSKSCGAGFAGVGPSAYKYKSVKLSIEYLSYGIQILPGNSRTDGCGRVENGYKSYESGTGGRCGVAVIYGVYDGDANCKD